MFLAVPMVIVTQKSTQDVIQGTSKLDNLLKVSVFQVYKKDIRAHVISQITSRTDTADSGNIGVERGDKSA